MKTQLLHGDCLERLKELPDNSVDAVVTDPPYGLSFMGKKWDYDVPSENIWRECLRVLKPGGHLLAFAGTRTQHRMAVRIEDAGFEIRDLVMWHYGSGFPKSLDVSKAIDKAAGAERVVVGEKITGNARTDDGWNGGQQLVPVTSPATDAARQWQGWGTALKPATEIVTVARKPLIGTVAANVLTHGTGAINIDGCRVGTETVETHSRGQCEAYGKRPGEKTVFESGRTTKQNREEFVGNPRVGRFPANLIHDGSDEVVGLFPQCKSGKPGNAVRTAKGMVLQGGGNGTPLTGFGDSGSAARFFYCAKASKRDREEGLEGFSAAYRPNGNKWTDQDYRVTRGERPPSAESGPRRNHHPTVKPTDLMRYLCRLVTPPGGTVLDPFMGSGSTGKAAMLEGFHFIGIEREAEYLEIAKARIEHAKNQQSEILV